LNGEVSEAEQNGSQAFTDRDGPATATFYYGQNGSDLRPGLLAPYVDPVLPTQSDDEWSGGTLQLDAERTGHRWNGVSESWGGKSGGCRLYGEP
jgi:hypothetical protein